MLQSEQAAHNRKVRVAVLAFLKDETYTTVEVIQKLVGYKTKQGTNGVLQKLAKDGLLKHHKMKNFAGRGLNLWGITTRGVYAINDPDELPDKVRGFEPSRISLATLDHKLQIQLVKIYLSELGWSILPVDPHVWDEKLPDAVCTKPDQEDGLIALEVELTIKSQRRYDDIIITYKAVQQKQRQQSLRRVVWLTETDKAAVRLRNLFKTLDENCLELHRFMSLDTFKGIKKVS